MLIQQRTSDLELKDISSTLRPFELIDSLDSMRPGRYSALHPGKNYGSKPDSILDPLRRGSYGTETSEIQMPIPIRRDTRHFSRGGSSDHQSESRHLSQSSLGRSGPIKSESVPGQMPAPGPLVHSSFAPRAPSPSPRKQTLHSGSHFIPD